MDRDQIQKKIESFYGTMSNAWELISCFHEDLGMDFGVIAASSNSEKTFINFVRNLISRSVIDRPMKSGRSLILTGENVLQIMVARKYISKGVSMNALKGHIAGKSQKELFEKLFADKLTDIVEITSEFTSSLIEEKMQNDETKTSADTDLFHYFDINVDMKLMVRQGTYSRESISRVVNYLKRQKRD